MYEAFAEVYDELMNDIDYEGWADYYVRLLSIYGIRSGKICECACGTGGLTIPLAARGFSMTGVDLSQEMLWQAAQKSRKAGSGFRRRLPRRNGTGKSFFSSLFHGSLLILNRLPRVWHR